MKSFQSTLHRTVYIQYPVKIINLSKITKVTNKSRFIRHTNENLLYLRVTSDNIKQYFNKEM